ncbi:MAG: Ig-like domain-containing protein, partial [Thermoplasmatota archaeon]
PAPLIDAGALAIVDVHERKQELAGKRVTVTGEVVKILDPQEKQHVPVVNNRFNWSVIPSFPVTQQSIIVNGAEIALEPDSRSHELELVQGENTIVVRVVDDDGLAVSSRRTIYVDLEPPIIEVICPAPGSFLTNELVHFKWSVSDLFTLVKVETKLDGEDWIERNVDEMNLMVSPGPHIFHIRAFDLAGNSITREVPINIGMDPGLIIFSPEPGTVTRLSTIEFRWEYTGSFEWTNALVRVDNTSQFIDVGGSKTFDIELERRTRLEHEGAYYITLKLTDDHGNYLEGYTSVIRDNTAPRVMFTLPEEFPNTNRNEVLLKWRGADAWGIEYYSIKINDGDWEDIGNQTEYLLELEEGEYTVSVRAVDLAGNVGSGETSFLVDRTRPTLQISSPVNNEVVKDPEIVFRWRVSDDIELNNVTFTLDGVSTIDVTGATMLTRSVVEEGTHSASITALDICGNLRTSTVTFQVDLTPPKVEWSTSMLTLTNSSSVLISWSVEDQVGLMEQRLLIDGDDAGIGIDDNNITVEMDDGSHTLELIALDFAEHEVTKTTTIVVDTTPPVILFDPEKCVVEGKIARVFWDASDDVSGISEGSFMISVDGGPPSPIPLGDRYATDVLAPGEHYVIVRCDDEAGNSASERWDFVIEKDGDTASEKGGAGFVLVVVGILVPLVVIVGVSLLLFLRSRKRKEEKGKPALNRPERLTLAIPAPRSMGRAAVPPASKVDALPSKKVEESSNGTGYIRPDKDSSDDRRPEKNGNGNGNGDASGGPDKEKVPQTPEGEKKVKD